MTDNYTIYKNLLYKMLRLRLVEHEIAERYPQGRMRCPTHLSIGQEAVSAVVGENLVSRDFAVSTHRAHAHYLAKGGNLTALVAELYGKETGCTRGRGGSMHLCDLKAGFVASTAIVGNTIPIGVGLAFSQQLKKDNHITCIFLGDAAIEEGVFFESLNFAVLKKLPVLFVCENNFYSVNTPFHLRQPIDRPIFKLAEGIGAKARQFDGNDALAMYQSVADVIKNLRDHGGPWFLEFHTYRYKVHCGPEDDLDYRARPKSEIDHWLARDPLIILKSQLIQRQALSEADYADWTQEIQQEINHAFHLAENASFPAAEDRFLFNYVHSDLTWLKNTLSKEQEAYALE